MSKYQITEEVLITLGVDIVDLPHGIDAINVLYTAIGSSDGYVDTHCYEKSSLRDLDLDIREEYFIDGGNPSTYEYIGKRNGFQATTLMDVLDGVYYMQHKEIAIDYLQEHHPDMVAKYIEAYGLNKEDYL